MATITLSEVECENITSGSGQGFDPDYGQITGSIGALFEFRCRATISGTDQLGGTVSDWFNKTLIFNAGLFLPTGTVAGPSALIGWAITYGGSVPSGTIAMNLIGCGSNTDACKNLSATATKFSNAAIDIKLRFRVTCDLEQWIAGQSTSNRSRLLRDKASTTTDVILSGASVFTGAARSILYCVTASGTLLGKTRALASFPFNARFYNASIAGTVGNPEVDLLGYTVHDEEYTVVPNLSAFQDRLVQFFWEKDIGWDVGLSCEYIVMDVTNSANNAGYIEDYTALGFQVGTINDDTTQWRLAITVPAASLINGHTYRIAVILTVQDTAEPTNTITNSFITDAIQAIDLPAALPIVATGTLKDYERNAHSSYAVTTVVDHLRAEVELDTTTYDAAAEPWATTFAQDITRIELSLVDTDDSDTLWTRFLYHVGGVWSANLTPGVGAPSNAIKVDTTTPGVFKASYVAPIEFLNSLGLPNLGGKNLLLQWRFIVRYPSLDWNVSYEFTQAMQVRDFQQFSGDIKWIKLFDYATGLPLVSLCDSDLVLVKVALSDSALARVADSGLPYHLRVYWNTQGWGYADPTSVRPNDGALEEDGDESPQGFERLDDAHLLNVPAIFDADGLAVFVFDHADIAEGEQIRLYVIAQPEAEPESPESPEPECWDGGTLSVSRIDGDPGQFILRISWAEDDVIPEIGDAYYTVNGGEPQPLTVEADSSTDYGPFLDTDGLEFIIELPEPCKPLRIWSQCRTLAPLNPPVGYRIGGANANILGVIPDLFSFPGGTPTLEDAYVVESMGNRPYRWNGAGWVEINPSNFGSSVSDAYTITGAQFCWINMPTVDSLSIPLADLLSGTVHVTAVLSSVSAGQLKIYTPSGDGFITANADGTYELDITDTSGYAVLYVQADGGDFTGCATITVVKVC